MIRGGITILVLLGLISRLVVPVSHVHAYSTLSKQLNHDAVPHVHVGNASHSHSHGPEGHSHPHVDELPLSSKMTDESCMVLASGQDHDSDAVVFPSAAGLVHIVIAKLIPICWAVGKIDSQQIGIFHGGAKTMPYAALELRAPASKLYIILRTLRI